MSIHRRKYHLKARAERQRETRDRIVAATVALHTEIGPARTTIAHIARRAGVQRLTVYNLFPESGDLFAACQHRFLTDSPPPDLKPSREEDPLEAFSAALLRLYKWYRANAAMECNVHRDRHLIPALDQLMARNVDARFSEIAEVHAAAIGPRRVSPRVRGIVRLALEFSTWELLTRCGLDDAGVAAVMAAAVNAARDRKRGAGPRQPRPGRTGRR